MYYISCLQSFKDFVKNNCETKHLEKTNAHLKQLSRKMWLEVGQEGRQLVLRKGSDLRIQVLACQARHPLAQELRPLSAQMKNM